MERRFTPDSITQVSLKTVGSCSVVLTSKFVDEIAKWVCRPRVN